MKSETNCPFCFSQDDPYIFFRNELFFSIYNRAPILPGHSLVVPRRHVSSFEELTDDELSGMLHFCKRVNAILQAAFPASGFNWTLQDGVAAGQTVEHLHVHIIPRKANDLPEPGDWYPKLKVAEQNFIDSNDRPQYTHSELIIISQRLNSIANKIYS